MNYTTEHIVDTTIYGIHKVKPDNKKRISIPTEWRELLRPGCFVHILNTWQYLMIVPEYLYKGDPDNIIHRQQISDDGRILIWNKFLDAFDIKIGKKVSLIGKWNHIELYWDESKLKEAISRSQQVASHFQAKIISQLQ
jgi:DNA-binding transcriptional regulator/RsmH inhibitor MraZ